MKYQCEICQQSYSNEWACLSCEKSHPTDYERYCNLLKSFGLPLLCETNLNETKSICIGNTEKEQSEKIIIEGIGTVEFIFHAKTEVFKQIKVWVWED